MKLFTGADLIIYFFIYGLLAWVLNTVIYSLKEQKYINTGVLNIPIIGCPAFIMILMIIVSSGKNVSYYGMLMMAFIDYLILEKMGLFFSQRLLLKKEISPERLGYGKNLKISLINAIIIIAVCFTCLKTLQPIIFSLVSLIPRIIVNIIALVLLLLLISDIVFTYIFVRKYPMKNMDTNIANRENPTGNRLSSCSVYSTVFYLQRNSYVNGDDKDYRQKKHPEAMNVIEQFIDGEYPNEVVRKLWSNMNFLEE